MEMYPQRPARCWIRCWNMINYLRLVRVSFELIIPNRRKHRRLLQYIVCRGFRVIFNVVCAQSKPSLSVDTQTFTVCRFDDDIELHEWTLHPNASDALILVEWVHYSLLANGTSICELKPYSTIRPEYPVMYDQIQRVIFNKIQFGAPKFAPTRIRREEGQTYPPHCRLCPTGLWQRVGCRWWMSTKMPATHLRANIVSLSCERTFLTEHLWVIIAWFGIVFCNHRAIVECVFYLIVGIIVYIVLI